MTTVVPLATWSTDADGRIDRTERHGSVVLVLENRLLMTDAWADELHPDDLDVTIEGWEDARRTGEVFEVTHRLRTADGTFRWHRTLAEPECDHEGRTVAWHGVSVDVHEREVAAAGLRQFEDHLRNVLDQLAEGFIVGDDSGNLLWWNRSALDMHGFADMSECRETLAEFHEIYELATPDGRALRPDEWPIARALRGEPVRGEELRLRRLDRDWSRWFLYGGAPLIDPRGRRLVFVTVIDVTDRRRANDELRRTNVALERSNTDLKQFAYAASHDLQSPLRSISSYAGLLASLEEPALDETGHRCVRTINAATERLRSLVNDLLSLSRVDSRAHPPEPVALNEVVDHVALVLDPVIRETGATVTRDDLPVLVGDAAQLTQLVQNLVDNALQYRSPATPEIHVHAIREPGSWTIAVDDNGIGIAPEHRRVIFEIFQRLHDDDIPGSGIGLAICRRIAHRHGGHIWVETSPGGGSSFRVKLPDELPRTARA
ncbi:MAG: ATP-binding protein [Actinomycetota bacterium]|nr:ATP-binding protein [Actinomycetota bacterium]